MGVVWKAEDTRLRRTVALKFLSSEVAGDQDTGARLVREAQASASLDHPNICQVFGIHEEEGETFIAMAFVDGPSLAEKIAERPMPLDDVLDIGVQVATGLKEAHDKGIVHRDVKPHNVMLTAKGQVKIMDFGLASLAGRSKLTKSGTTLGTPAYMAPEQLEGRTVDRRADIWALGCLLYEMLTQRTPFDAEYEQAISYGILNENPEPVTALRFGLPTEIDRVISKTLAKDTDERYQHADELAVDLRSLRKAAGEREVAKSVAHAPEFEQDAPLEAGDGEAPSKASSTWRERLAWVLAGGLALALTAAVVRRPPEPVGERAVRRWSFAPEGLQTTLRPAAISPNGRHIVYVARSGAEPRLWVRDMDDPPPRLLVGTEGAAHGPFWSPDSEWIGFATVQTRSSTILKKIHVSGTPLISVATFDGGWGSGSWSPDGATIIFSRAAQIHSVAAGGGEAKALLAPVRTESGSHNYYPYWLPREDRDPALIITSGAGDQYDLVLKRLGVDDTSILALGGISPSYDPSGHLVFSRSTPPTLSLWALPFDLSSLKVSGTAFRIRDGGQGPSLSSDGTLVYVEPGSDLQRLAWRDRAGRRLGGVGRPQSQMRHPAISPDGRRIAVGAREQRNADVWIHDAEGARRTRLTISEQVDHSPQWSPDGRRISYVGWEDGNPAILERGAGGSGEARVLIRLGGTGYNYGWSPLGDMFFYSERRDERYSIFSVSTTSTSGPADPAKLFESPFDAHCLQASPDGRFIVYVSERTGTWDVFVRTLRQESGPYQVSSGGGRSPRWSKDGKELYYVRGDSLVAVPVDTSSRFSSGDEQILFSNPGLAATPQTFSFDVAADGRFLLIEEAMDAEGAIPPSIQVVENWFEEFRSRPD